MENNKEALERIYGTFKNQEFLSFVGMKLESVEKGKVAISCENKKEFSQALGFMHGGMIASIADTAGGYAALTLIPSDCHVLTSELKINYMRPAVSKKVIGIGEVINQGKNLIIVESTIKNENDDMIAKMMATMFIVKR